MSIIIPPLWLFVNRLNCKYNFEILSCFTTPIQIGILGSKILRIGTVRYGNCLPIIGVHHLWLNPKISFGPIS